MCGRASQVRAACFIILPLPFWAGGDNRPSGGVPFARPNVRQPAPLVAGCQGRARPALPASVRAFGARGGAHRRKLGPTTKVVALNTQWQTIQSHRFPLRSRRQHCTIVSAGMVTAGNQDCRISHQWEMAAAITISPTLAQTGYVPRNARYKYPRIYVSSHSGASNTSDAR